jgi:hypothetical protein
MDPLLLPPETQAMATAALSRGRTTSFNTLSGGKPALNVKKMALYMYSSAHYDFATPQQMRDFSSERDTLCSQAVTGSYAKLLPQAIALADKELLLAQGDRVSWVKVTPSSTASTISSTSTTGAPTPNPSPTGAPSINNLKKEDSDKKELTNVNYYGSNSKDVSRKDEEYELVDISIASEHSSSNSAGSSSETKRERERERRESNSAGSSSESSNSIELRIQELQQHQHQQVGIRVRVRVRVIVVKMHSK